MAKNVDAPEQANTFDPARVEKIVNKIEGEHEGLLSERMSYMGRCRPYRERINQHYEEAAAFGIPKKILKAKIKERDLRRKIDGIADDFEDDDRETFEQVTQALGDLNDTPLGRAAAQMDRSETEAAPKRPRGRPRKAPSADAAPAKDDADDDRDLRPPHLQQARVSDEETEAYKAGVAAREAGGACSIPNNFQGDDRDRWHSGWSAKDEAVRNKDAATENSERLAAGISPLH